MVYTNNNNMPSSLFFACLLLSWLALARATNPSLTVDFYSSPTCNTSVVTSQNTTQTTYVSGVYTSPCLAWQTQYSSSVIVQCSLFSSTVNFFSDAACSSTNYYVTGRGNGTCQILDPSVTPIIHSTLPTVESYAVYCFGTEPHSSTGAGGIDFVNGAADRSVSMSIGGMLLLFVASMFV